MSAYRSNGGTLVPLTAVRSVTQGPLYLQDDKVNCFVDLMQKDCEFPPIQVQEIEGGFYKVLNGHHRFAASHRCSFTHIPVEIIGMP
jgi:ParB-like nuclease family protein